MIVQIIDNHFKFFVLIFFLFLFLFSGISYIFADDWSSCADALNALSLASKDASEAAEETESAKHEFEDAKDELENCITYPDIYDFMDDQCQSLKWEYNYSKNDYNSALSHLSSELYTVDSRIRSVESCCEISFSITSLGITPSIPKAETLSAPKAEASCSTFSSLIGKLPIDRILYYCKQVMSESECKKCLELK